MGVSFTRDTYRIDLALFENQALDLGYPSWRHTTWRTAATDIDSLPDVQFRYADEYGERSVRLARAGALALVSLDRRGKVNAWIAAHDENTLESVFNELRGTLPLLDDPVGESSVRFWTMGAHHPNSSERSVAVTDWADIRGNYERSVSRALDGLVERTQPPAGGQLMLWHGAAGTGKTHAIRALINAWRTWIRPEYVVDPEAFFGGSASYIMSVLLGEDDEDELPQHFWRLLIFEDTGELLSADAKERVGQGLSRMLNSVDGLMGQGLRVLTLITTNEDLRRLHPAVTRPGRCSVNLRFGPLDRETAEQWATSHDLDLPKGRAEFTAAELFALADGRAVDQPESPSIGFYIDRN